MARFKRILLKLSGESLMGKQGFGIDPDRLSDYAKQIKEAHDMGVQIGIVIGGGNIFRGLSGSQKGFDRVKGDQMGMCATVINSLALSSALGAIDVKTKVLTAIRMEPIGEFYSKWKAIEAMEAGYVAYSLQVLVVLISQLILVVLYVVLKLRLMLCSRVHVLMVSIRLIQKKILRRQSSVILLMMISILVDLK